MIKKIMPLLLIAALGVGMAAAQPPDRPPREKIEAMKVAFLTDRLDLTVEEAQRFWPVYNQYQSARSELRGKCRKNREGLKGDLDNMSDSQVEKMMEDRLAYEQQEVDLRRQYHQEFMQVLPPRKVALLYKAEHDFKLQLLHKMRGHDDDDGPPHHGPHH